MKEAKILQNLNHPNVVGFKYVCYKPLAIMLEYVSFSFAPFGNKQEISGLNEFLRFLDYFSAKKMEYFFRKILLDIIDGLQFLHNRGIAHRDLKPANILVSNFHYSNLTNKVDLNEAIRSEPVRCILTDFGESRSKLLQTRTVLATRTKHIQRGTLLFMAPEQLPGKNFQHASQEDLIKTDIWQLGMTIFCLLNSDLNSPFDVEFKRMADIPDNPDQFIADYLNIGRLQKCLTNIIFKEAFTGNNYIRHIKCVCR